MDILLGRFLEHGYDEMGEAERQAFERLLDLPDQDILGWLWGDDTALPEDPTLAAVVRRIRRVLSAP